MVKKSSGDGSDSPAIKKTGNLIGKDDASADKRDTRSSGKRVSAAPKGGKGLNRTKTMAETMKEGEEFLKRVADKEEETKGRPKRTKTMSATMKEGEEFLKRGERAAKAKSAAKKKAAPAKKAAPKKKAAPAKGKKAKAEESSDEESGDEEEDKKKGSKKAAPKKAAGKKKERSRSRSAEKKKGPAKEPEKKMQIERRKTKDDKDLCNFACSGPAHPEPAWCDKLLGHDGDHYIDCECVKGMIADKIDVVFCIDATGSMGSYINESKAAITNLVKEFSTRSKQAQFGVVAYRDHTESTMTSFLTKVGDLTTGDGAIKFLQDLSASGGGDFPEAVFDGLRDSVDKITWRDNIKENVIRILVHIGDAPPHGKEFGHSGSHPDGCPCGLKLKDIADKLNNARIRYKLVKCNDAVTQMGNIFKGSFIFYDEKPLKNVKELVSGIWDMVAREISPMDRIKAH